MDSILNKGNFRKEALERWMPKRITTRTKAVKYLECLGNEEILCFCRGLQKPHEGGNNYTEHSRIGPKSNFWIWMTLQQL